MHQLVPVAVAQLVDVEPERRDQVLRVTRRETALGQHGAQRHALRIGRARPQQTRLQAIEQFELALGREVRMVGDIVGHADELVERQDRSAEARGNELRGDGKVLVPMPLARSQFACPRHRCRAASAWTRPFHRPPRPRPC